MDSLYNGGTEKSLLDLASRFEKIDPVFCCFYEHRHLAEAFERAGLRVHFLGMDDDYGFRRAAHYLEQVLSEEQPDLVVGHLLRAELVTRWLGRRTNTPVVGSFVNDTYAPEAYATQSRSRRFKTNVFRLLNAVSARWCVHFISNSEAIGRSNARALGIPEERVSVVPRGRDESVYFPPEGGRSGPVRTVLSVARLLERKGQRELIQAFARVAPSFPEARLLIAGEGVFRPALEREIARSGLADRIELLGNISDVPALLRQADLFAFPSHYEGFSGALVEAMLTALPIVASGIPMNLEAVEDERTARIFPARDVDALAAQLRWCFEHPDEARAMGRRAREAALARFTLDRVAARYEALLLDLVARFAAPASQQTPPLAPASGGRR